MRFHVVPPPPPDTIPRAHHSSTSTLGPGRCRHLGHPPIAHLSVILLYLRSEHGKNENVQENVGNTPNSNTIWHWRINQLSKSPWAVHKIMPGSCNLDFMAALFSRCFQPVCLEMHCMFLFIYRCRINSLFYHLSLKRQTPRTLWLNIGVSLLREFLG